MAASCGPDLATEGLSLYLDSSNSNSYGGSGGTWRNLCENGLDATVSNSPQFVSSDPGYFLLNGANQYATVPANSAFNFTASGVNFAIEAWVYPTGNGSSKTIVANWGNGGVGVSDSWLLWSNNGTLSFTWSPHSNVNPLLTGGTLPLNTWCHVAVTRSGNAFTLYLNGAATATATNSATSASSYSLEIGRYGTNTLSYWEGRIQSIRIYSGSTLTALEVAANYGMMRSKYSTITSSLTASSLALHYDIGSGRSYGGSGTTITDLSGNGRNGTIVGGAAYSSSNGGYLTLDSGSKYISLPANIFNSTAFTLELWVYQSTQPTTAVLFASTGSNSTGFWGIGSNSGGYWFSTYNGSTRPGLGSGTSITGAWNHVVATRDASNNAALYVNGVVRSSGLVTTAFASGTPLLGVNPINSSERLNGRISIARYHTAALTADQVLNNFNIHRDRYGV